MTTTATRSLAWRTAPTVPPVPIVRAKHNDRMWMGKPLVSYQADELREILFALEFVAYGHVTASDGMSRHDLIDACGEVDAEMDRRRGAKLGGRA